MDRKLSRMKELIDILNEAGRAYYSTNQEIMTNYEYDKLYDELMALEKETGIVNTNSPTVNVGYESVSELPKEKHESPMLSLDKTKEISALESFANIQKSLLSWKMDGLTVVMTYNEGHLLKSVTRGNGEEGEVITNNARTFKNLPLSIPYKGKLVIRGEAVISYENFEKINAEISIEEEKYKNPRNLCSGSVRQLNNEITAKRNVDFFAFSVVVAEGVDFENSRECQMLWLQSLGFKTVEYKVVTGKNMADAVEKFAEEVKNYEYPSDGLVLQYDDIEYGLSLGRTAKFPKDSIAFKWADEIKSTKLIQIEWSPSRTGLINPVAIFETVELEGTTVSRASLHNISVIEELELGIGDVVNVYKANMIIPQIASNDTRSNNIDIPKVCPVCGQETSINNMNGTKTLMCNNKACMAKHIKGLTHFVGRDAMNIEGLSESTLEKFVERGFIKEFADIYRLERYKDIIVSMEGFGKKSYDKLIAAISASKQVSLPKFIYSLGILNIGLANAKVICKACNFEIEKVMTITKDELVTIEGVGEVIAKTFTEYFENEENVRQVRELLEVITFNDEVVSGDAILSDKVFVITGSVEHFKNRNELKEVIENLGGKVTGSVTGNTSYLINNDVNSTSSKNKTAAKLGVPVISEEDFLRLIGK